MSYVLSKSVVLKPFQHSRSEADRHQMILNWNPDWTQISLLSWLEAFRGAGDALGPLTPVRLTPFSWFLGGLLKTFASFWTICWGISCITYWEARTTTKWIRILHQLAMIFGHNCMCNFNWFGVRIRTKRQRADGLKSLKNQQFLLIFERSPTNRQT